MVLTTLFSGGIIGGNTIILYNDEILIFAHAWDQIPQTCSEELVVWVRTAITWRQGFV